MKPGEISEVVETQFGYHIIKLTEKKAAEKVEFKEARPRIEEFLKGPEGRCRGQRLPGDGPQNRQDRTTAEVTTSNVHTSWPVRQLRAGHTHIPADIFLDRPDEIPSNLNLPRYSPFL